MSYGNGGVENESLLDRAKRCFKLACEAEAEQRKRELDDLRFQIPEYQWDEAAKAERRGDASQGIPPRPMVSISLLHQPMQLVQNQAASAKLGVSIHPVSEEADDDLAEVKQGLYRRIERDSNADQARLWALDRAKQCGRGWYRVNTQWDEDGDDDFDQEIVIERILHQECVYMDPSAQKPDFSDAEWAFIVAWVAINTFRRKYPKAKPSTAQDRLAFENLESEAPDWVRGEGDRRAIQVAEYFYKVHDYETMTSEDGLEREMDRVTVKWCKLTGYEILKQQDWNGHLIPLIPVIGRELQPFDGERRWEGMVRPARDAQRIFNFALSSVIEDISRISKAPNVGAEGQFEGHELEWAQANRQNLPYLEYKLKALGDQLAPPPGPMQVDGTKMQLSMALTQEGKALIQSATAIYDPSLGRETTRDKSGRAILALQQQADAGSSHYIQGLATISMPYEARVVLDLMPAIYDRPGRITRVLGGEDEEEIVMLGAPFVMDQRGRPVQVQEGQTGAKLYDLSRGKYSTSVSIGKSYQTRLQQGQEELGELLPNLPPEAQVILLPTYLKFRDTPGAEEAADLMKAFRDKNFPGLGDKKDAPTPEQAQAKLQALEQQLQLMGSQLQAAIKAIETDQAKQAATLQKTEMEIASRERIAAADNQTKLMIEGINQRFESLEALLQRSHEQAQHHEDLAHDVAMAAAGGKTATFKREDGRETGQESEEESSRRAMPEEATT